MYKNNNFRSRMIGIFIVSCIALIAGSFVFTARTVLDFTLPAASFSGIALFCLLYLWHRQRLLLRSLQQLNDLIVQPEDYENDILRRLGDLSRRVEQLSGSANSNQAAEDNSMEQLRQELLRVSERLEQMGLLVLSAAKPRDKVVPLHDTAAKEAASDSRKASVRASKPAAKDQNNGSNGSKKPALRPVGRNNALAVQLQKAIDTGDLELHLQPIVDLRNREPAFYETMIRVKKIDGSYVDDEHMGKISSMDNLSTLLGRKLVFDSVRMLRALDGLNRKTGLFCRLPLSLIQDEEAIADTYSLLKANKIFADSLILQIDQQDWNRLQAAELEQLSRIVELGFSLSLGNTQVFDFSGSKLHLFGFRYLNTHFAEIQAMALVGGSEEQLIEFSTEMNRCKLDVVVSGIDQDTQILTLVDSELPLGQGVLFAPPRPVKVDLLKPIDNKTAMTSFGTAIGH